MPFRSGTLELLGSKVLKLNRYKKMLLKSRHGYSHACAVLGAETLKKRRQSICLKFAAKNLKSENCLLNIARTSHHNLRQRNKVVDEYKCHTSRFKRTSLPFLASLVNNKLRV